MLKDYKIGQTVDLNEFVFEENDIKENDSVYKRIYGKSFQDNEFVFIEDLVYVKLLHYGYDDKVKVGELIVHKAILDETKEVFSKLFDAKYQIYSMKLIDDFWVDNDTDKTDRNSVLNNNSSSFCFRNIAGKKKLSKHSLGIAIDINPLVNPYTSRNSDGSFDSTPLSEYEKSFLSDREEKAKQDPHIIVLGDYICKTFDSVGFECGGIWPLQSELWACDWQHFEPNTNKITEVMERIDNIHKSNAQKHKNDVLIRKL